MGIVQKLVGNKPTEESASASPPSGGSPVPDGRGRLRIVAAELAKAKECVADLEMRVNLLNRIITDADAAHAALQAAIAADGGVALEAYGAGNADQSITQLVARKENKARAASAAKDALPNTLDMLSKARAEETRLEAAKFDAVIVHLKMRASDEHKQYTRAFRDLSDSYDKFCGIAIALSASGHSEMMTTGLPVQITAPGFNMGTGPAHGASELVTMTHPVNEMKISSASAKWMAARERLIADADANLDDLIG